MRSPALVRTAATVLAIEGAAMLGFAVIELFGLGAGEAASLPTAIALIVLTLIGAAALIAFAVGTMRDRTWARSGGVRAAGARDRHRAGVAHRRTGAVALRSGRRGARAAGVRPADRRVASGAARPEPEADSEI